MGSCPPAAALSVVQCRASSAEIGVPGLVEAVKRVALVTERNAPVRMEFADGSVSLTAGGDDEGRAEEQLEVSYEGDSITTAFNPQFLLGRQRRHPQLDGRGDEQDGGAGQRE